MSVSVAERVRILREKQQRAAIKAAATSGASGEGAETEPGPGELEYGDEYTEGNVPGARAALSPVQEELTGEESESFEDGKSSLPVSAGGLGYGRETATPAVETEPTERELLLAERERELAIREREIQAETLRLDQKAREEELHLRQSARNMGLGLAIPSLKLAGTLSDVADEIARKVRSNIQNMSMRDLQSVANIATTVADKATKIVETAFKMEREARSSLPANFNRIEEFETPEEALEALEELARTVDRYGEGVVVEDEFPGENNSGEDSEPV